MTIYASLMLISLLIVCTFSFNYPRLVNDYMCKDKGGILCIKDELIIIATIAKGIARKLNETEKNIQKIKALERLNKNVNVEMSYTSFNLPTRYYHDAFFRQSNINKEFLSELFFEAHDAMIYYNNSINDLLNLKVLSAQEQNVDDSFKKIQANIQDEMICRYRSILNFYSNKWKSVHKISRLQFSKQRLCPSCIHNVHSVVIARYLRGWMELINEVIINLEMKFF